MTPDKVRPAEIEKEVYKDFKKYCIENDLEKGKALERAILSFIQEGE